MGHLHILTSANNCDRLLSHSKFELDLLNNQLITVSCLAKLKHRLRGGKLLLWMGWDVIDDRAFRGVLAY